LEDGPLLAVAQNEFDVLVTIDRSLEFQQNLSRFQISVIVVHVPKNQLPHYQILKKELLQAVENAMRGKVFHVRTPPLSMV
jgi:hypothetical protein